jgi:hypothetical protein
MPVEPDPPETAPALGPDRRGSGGFQAAGALVGRQIRAGAAARGFAVTRVLTDWPELAGPELARLCRPVRVSYGRKGLGATLVIETPGAAAPLVQTRVEALRARINAVYGYNAIARVQVQQGGMAVLHGLAEAPAAFAGPAPALKSDNLALPSQAARARAEAVLGALGEGVTDERLKAALDRLAMNVLGRRAPVAPAPATNGKDRR